MKKNLQGNNCSIFKICYFSTSLNVYFDIFYASSLSLFFCLFVCFCPTFSCFISPLHRSVIFYYYEHILVVILMFMLSRVLFFCVYSPWKREGEAFAWDWPLKQSQDDVSLKKKSIFGVCLPFRAAAAASGNFRLCNNGKSVSRPVKLPPSCVFKSCSRNRCGFQRFYLEN